MKAAIRISCLLERERGCVDRGQQNSHGPTVVHFICTIAWNASQWQLFPVQREESRCSIYHCGEGWSPPSIPSLVLQQEHRDPTGLPVSQISLLGETKIKSMKSTLVNIFFIQRLTSYLKYAILFSPIVSCCSEIQRFNAYCSDVLCVISSKLSWNMQWFNPLVIMATEFFTRKRYSFQYGFL